MRANIPDGVNEARIKSLKERTIPMVSGAPGFIAGYWCDTVDDKGMAFVVFEDEASAKAAAPPAGADMGEGVTIDSVEFRDVIASS